MRPYFLARPSKESKNAYEIASLSDYSSFFSSVPPASQIIGFLDPSASPQYPGWPLRNVLAYLRTRFLNQGHVQLRVLCWRDTEPPPVGKHWKSRFGVLEVVVDETRTVGERPSAVGWEKNPQGKLGPKLADLAPMMDPARFIVIVYFEKFETNTSIQTCKPSC